MTVQKVFALNERQYTDSQGVQNVFISRGMILSDGIDTLYAELTGESARRNDLAEGQTCIVQLCCKVREWEDRNHVKRYSNEMTISRIGL